MRQATATIKSAAEIAKVATNPAPAEADPDCSPRSVQSWRSGAAVYVRLNRPAKANSYTQDMLGALADEIRQAAADETCRVLVVTGTGESFCAGADLREIRDRHWRAAWNLKSAEVFQLLSSCRLVTLAAINGAAVGGGLELALACDIRLAADRARFWFPEPELGLIPAAGGTQRLCEIVGPARAKEMILGGAAWNAADALRFGLVGEVATGDQLLARTQVWVERISRRDGNALELAKHAIDMNSARGGGHDFERAAQSLLCQLREPTAK